MGTFEVGKMSLRNPVISWLLLSFLISSVLARTQRCTGDVDQFRCITAESLWSQRCISIDKVCDGVIDCEDYSDEWHSLCSHMPVKCQIWNPDGLPGFACDYVFFENSTLFNVTKYGNASVPSIATAKHNYSHYNNDDNNGANNNPSLTNISAYWPTCISISRFCDGRMDCSDWDPMGRTLDERYCTCNDNPQCYESQTRPGGNWWLRILATTTGIIVLFAFFVCAAIQWEKHRVAILVRRREQQQRRHLESISRRAPPSNGQVNFAVAFDPAEFGDRIHASGGAAMAPPPYTAAIAAFPKPPSASPSDDLPPPYQPEWSGAFHARSGNPGVFPVTQVAPETTMMAPAAASVAPMAPVSVTPLTEPVPASVSNESNGPAASSTDASGM